VREGTEVIDDERETPRVASLAASEVMEEVEERQRVRHAMDAPQQSLPKPKPNPKPKPKPKPKTKTKNTKPQKAVP